MKTGIQSGVVLFFFISASLLMGQSKAPKPFSSYMKPNKVYKAEVVTVVPPKGFNQYLDKVEASAKKDPAWFKEYSDKSKPGVPLPYHQKLGLTKKEYQEYRKMWKAREYQTLQKVEVKLEQAGDEWRVLVSGAGAKISLLKFDPKKGTIKSPNGEMKRIEDIDAEAETIFGAWKGAEWKFLEETGLGSTKENFAIGRSGDGKHGMLLYRLLDKTSKGRVLFDQSMVIRFALK